MKLLNMRLTALGVLMVLLLAACNMPITPTPHPTPTAQPQVTEAPVNNNTVGATCLVGTWQITDLTSYLEMALPQMVEGATVKVGEVSGNLTYTFNADGTTAGEAENFKIKAQVTTNGVSLPGQITVNGTSSGNYQADDSQGIVTLTNLQPGDLKVSASVAGIPVANQTPLTGLIMFGSAETGSGSANYQCIGNTLQISVDIPNVGPRVVALQRVQ